MIEATEADGRLRILIADDEPVNVLILSKMLDRCGMSCEIARDGRECVEKAEAGRYDIIFMDINMPHLDGVAAAREITRRLTPKEPKVIAVTANDTGVQRRECDEAGFSGFIAKPVRIDTLKATLASQL